MTTTLQKPKRRTRPKVKNHRPRVTKAWRNLLCSLPEYDPFRGADDCWFDAEKAQYYIDFIETCCTHIEGALAGKPFILKRWEKAIVANIFGWLMEDSYGRTVRRFREVLIYVCRKNGKTPLAAAIMNAIFFLDEEIGQQNFCAAGERDQATLSFRHIAGMIHNEIEMESRVQDYKASRTIVRESDQSFIKVLSSDADTKHGGNPHVVIVDELHVQKNRDLVDVLETAMTSLNRLQPLMIHLTTADYMRESICNEKYEYACKVRTGAINNIRFLPVIYEAQPEDDWTKVKTWKKGNPNLGVSVSIDSLREACERANEVPAYENTFKRLHLNIRTEQDVRWMPIETWDACDFEVNEDELIGKRCFTGFDLSSNIDIAGYALVFEPDEDCKRWRVVPRLYMPRDNAERREKLDKVPYLTWEREKYITLTEGNVVDYATIKANFEADSSRFNIAEAAFDRWNFEGPRQQFIHDGMPEDKFVSFGQGFASMSAPMKKLNELLLSRLIAHGGHPVLRWMASNVAVEMDAAENIKPSKKKSTGRIDGIVMIIMALGRAMVVPEEKKSVYEDRGILTLGEDLN
jgi:phage terminase large subunit-like protein